VPHRCADLDHLADEFVTEDDAGFHARKISGDKVEIRPADSAERGSNQDVGRRLNLRFGHRVDSDGASAREHDRAH
jgi:hypothetical protein